VLRRAALVAAGVVVGVALFLGWLLGTASGHARLRAWLVEDAARALNGRLEVAALEGGPLRGWRLVAPRVLDETGAEVLAAEAVDLELGLGAGGVQVVSIRLVAPRVHLAWRPDGVLNVAALWREPPPGLPLDERPAPPRLRIAKLVVERGTLDYAGRPGPAVAFSDVAGELSFETADRTSRLRVGWLSASLKDGPVARLAGDAVFGPRLIDLPQAELRLGDSVLEVEARYERPEGQPSTLDVEIGRAMLAVPEIVRWLPGARLPDGVTVRGSVHGKASDLRVAVAVDGGTAGAVQVEGKLGFVGVPSYALALHGEAVDLNAWTPDLPPTRLTIDATMEGQRLAPAATVGRWTISARGDVGGLAAGELRLPLALDAGRVTFSGASWAAIGLPDFAGEWKDGTMLLRAGAGGAAEADSWGSLVLRFQDVEGETRWELRVGTTLPERVLYWRPGAGWKFDAGILTE
jgi:hypothetical protein